ncbi:MgtC/SapB family protein, partial [Pseudomonas aeruginosa]
MRLHRGGEPDGYRRQRRPHGGRRTAVRAPRGRLLLWCAQARRHPLSRRMESSMTLSLDLLLSLCTALAIGLLIGAERGWQERDHEDARQIAGIRTFSLAGLLGGFATLLAGELGSAVWVALLLALAALAVAGYVSDVRRGGDQGMTTEIALLMTFLLGSLALTEQRLLAAAGGIVLTLLLSLKDKLHALLKRLTAEELSGTLKLLFISVVLLPVLPNQGYGPWAFFNPYLTWWMVVLIAALGFSAYLAIRLIGSRKGLLLTAVLGGLVSSTVMTLTLARLRERMPDALLACALLATSALMFPRILVEIGAIHPALLKELALPFAATTLVYLGGTLFHA